MKTLAILLLVALPALAHAADATIVVHEVAGDRTITVPQDNTPPPVPVPPCLTKASASAPGCQPQ